MDMSASAWRTSPVLGVRDVRKTAEYYRDVLGFNLDPEHGVFQPTADEPGGVYGIVERSGAMVHFQIRRGELPERKRGTFERDLYIYVHDLAALHAELQRRGANIVQPPKVAPYGIREIEVVDLNGHRLTFGEIVD
jgi:uncharacterized glyoxalase superfamily protein PhnB